MDLRTHDRALWSLSASIAVGAVAALAGTANGRAVGDGRPLVDRSSAQTFASTLPDPEQGDVQAVLAGLGASQLDFLDDLETQDLVCHDDALHAALVLGAGINAATFEQRVAMATKLGWVSSGFDQPALEAVTVGEAARVLSRMMGDDASLSQEEAVSRLAAMGAMPASLKPYQGITGSQYLTILGAVHDAIGNNKPGNAAPRRAEPAALKAPAPQENTSPAVEIDAAAAVPQDSAAPTINPARVQSDPRPTGDLEGMEEEMTLDLPSASTPAEQGPKEPLIAPIAPIAPPGAMQVETAPPSPTSAAGSDLSPAITIEPGPMSPATVRPPARATGPIPTPTAPPAPPPAPTGEPLETLPTSPQTEDGVKAPAIDLDPGAGSTAPPAAAPSTPRQHPAPGKGAQYRPGKPVRKPTVNQDESEKK